MYGRLAAGDEQNVVFHVHRQAGAGVRLSGQFVMTGDFHGFRIDHGDVVFILDIDVNVAFPVGYSLLRRAAQIDGAKDGAVF